MLEVPYSLNAILRMLVSFLVLERWRWWPCVTT